MSLKALVVAFIVSLASPILASAQLPESKTTKPQIRREQELGYAIGRDIMNKPELQRILTDERDYDPKGNLLKLRLSMPRSCALPAYQKYVINEQGQRLEAIDLTHDDREAGGKTLYTYDSVGRCIREETTRNADTILHRRREVSEKSIKASKEDEEDDDEEDKEERKERKEWLALEKESYKFNKKYKRLILHHYDQLGRKVETSISIKPKGYHERRLFTYDNEGRCIEERWYKDKALTYIQYWRFDKQGKVLEHLYGNSPKHLSRKVYTYDSLGREVEIQQYGKEGELQEQTTHSYGQRGKIIKTQEIKYTDIKRIQLTLYSYNKQGDCIDELKYYNLPKGSPTLQQNTIAEALALSESNNYYRTIQDYTYDKMGRVTQIMKQAWVGYNVLEVSTYHKTIEYYE